MGHMRRPGTEETGRRRGNSVKFRRPERRRIVRSGEVRGGLHSFWSASFDVYYDNLHTMRAHFSQLSHFSTCARFDNEFRCNTYARTTNSGTTLAFALQHIEKVLPGGILHAPVAVGKHAQSRAAQADRWQLPASACHLTKCFGVRACGLLQTWSFIRILYALNERERNKLYKISYWE